MKNLIQLNARNIINLDDITKFINSVIFEEDTDEIIEWLRKQLKVYLLNDYTNVVPVTTFKDSDPDWLKKSIKEGLALRIYIDDETLFNTLNHILDYFHSLDGNELNKISKLSFEVANTKAKQWTEELNEKATIEEDHSGIEAVREYPDSFKWVKVFSKQALNREGKLMRHCVGSYYDKVTSGKCVVYSLRNEKNIPKCTVEVIKTEVNQIKGFANGPIQEKYVKYVQNFIEKPIKGEKYDKVRDLMNIGILVQDKVWWNIYKLPKNFIVKGDLFIRDCTIPDFLPEELTIKGYLALKDCTSLISLPKGLKVENNLNLSGCTSLTSLPKGLSINGILCLIGCTSLKYLPEGLSVKGDLNLKGCTSLKSLPERLSVIGTIRVDLTFPKEKYPSFKIKAERGGYTG